MTNSEFSFVMSVVRTFGGGRSLVGLGLLLSTATLCLGQDRGVAATQEVAPPLVDSELGATRNVHRCGSLFLAGQPTADDFATLKERGVALVVTLREGDEAPWEKSAAESAGLELVEVPFRAPDTLTDQVFDRVRNLLATDKPTLLHCGSANRVGAVWMAHRVLDQGVELEVAVAEAKQVGLRNPGYEQRALHYIRRMQARAATEGSVRPGINENFLKPDLDLKEWLGRFEVESREVFSAREAVLKATGAQAGWRVADVGAGTGFFSRMFSAAVGENGWVYAVDISPRFLAHINEQSEADGVKNITGVLGSGRSINLPPESVELTFICDTYHHFEFPRSTLASIHHALKENGVLVVIDFEKIPGQTREFLMSHVRAGKQEFRGEIELAGFEFIGETRIDGFRENYFLRFRKR